MAPESFEPFVKDPFHTLLDWLIEQERQSWNNC
jgi:hypothetical protein